MYRVINHTLSETHTYDTEAECTTYLNNLSPEHTGYAWSVEKQVDGAWVAHTAFPIPQ